ADNDGGSGPGGGIAVGAGVSATITGCLFTRNHTAGLGGGGLFVHGGNAVVRVERCRLMDNRADSGGNGGGIQVGVENGSGGFTLDCTIESCVLFENRARFGGGLYAAFSVAAHDFHNLTIAGNLANRGGAVFDVSSPLFTNCVFWGNRAIISDPEI